MYTCILKLKRGDEWYKLSSTVKSNLTQNYYIQSKVREHMYQSQPWGRAASAHCWSEESWVTKIWIRQTYQSENCCIIQGLFGKVIQGQFGMACNSINCMFGLIKFIGKLCAKFDRWLCDREVNMRKARQTHDSETNIHGARDTRIGHKTITPTAENPYEDSRHQFIKWKWKVYSLSGYMRVHYCKWSEYILRGNDRTRFVCGQGSGSSDQRVIIWR